MDEQTQPTVDELLRHTEFLRALAHSLIGDSHLADDVVQDTLAVALERPPELGNLRAWLATVLRNRIRTYFRTRSRRTQREQVVSRPEPSNAVDETAATLEVQRKLVDAVATLDEPLRTTLMLRFYEGMTAVEIADRMSVSERTVRRRVKDAVSRLRIDLDSNYGGNRGAWSLALAPLLGTRPKRMAAVTASAAWFSLRVALTIVLVAAAATLGIWNYAARREGPAPSRVHSGINAVPQDAAGSTGSTPMRAAHQTASSVRVQVEEVIGPGARGARRAAVGATVDLFDSDGRGLLWVRRGEARVLQSSTVGEDGKAEFKRLRAGRYWVRASKAGFTAQATSVVLMEDGQVHPRLKTTPRGIRLVENPSVDLTLREAAPVVATVLSVETGKPIGRASVTVIEGGPAHTSDSTVLLTAMAPCVLEEAITDGIGEARLQRITRHFGNPRSYTFIARADGYARAVITIPAHFLEEGEPIRIFMQRGGRVTGTVRNETGAIMARMDVAACLDGADADRARLGAASEPETMHEAHGAEHEAIGSWMFAVTDAYGRFELQGVLPGQPYIVFASTDKYFSTLPEQLATVAAGGVARIDVLVRTARQLTATIVDASGEPVRGLRADVHIGGRPQEMNLVTGRHSTFRALLPFDTKGANIRIRGEGRPPQLFELMPVQLASGAVTLVASTGRTLAGVLVDSAGLPVSGWNIEVQGCDCAGSSAKTMADGTFRIAVACDKRHTFRATQPRRLPLERLHENGGAGTVSLGLPSVACWAGRVQLVLPRGIGPDTQPHHKVWTTGARYTSRNRQMIWSGGVREVGTMRSFNGDAPHALALVEGCEPAEIRLPLLPSVGSEVPIHRVQLKRADWANVRGRVLDAEGLAVPDAEVTSNVTYPGQGDRSLTSQCAVNADGEFHFAAPIGGKASVSAELFGHQDAWHRIDLVDEYSVVKLRLRACRRVSGVVVDSEGHPLKGRFVGCVTAGMELGVNAGLDWVETDDAGRFSLDLRIGTQRLALRPPRKDISGAELSWEESQRRFAAWQRLKPFVFPGIRVPPIGEEMKPLRLRVESR